MNASSADNSRAYEVDAAAVTAICSSAQATTARVRSLLRRWSPSEARVRLIDRSAEALRALTDDGCRASSSVVAEWGKSVQAQPLERILDDLRARQEMVWWSRPSIAGDTAPMAEADSAVSGRSESDHALLYELLSDDDDHPPVLFLQGDVDALRRPRVAIVGTRNATSLGREMARTLGRELSDRGVAVISGLALGIDAAAHLGAVASAVARPVGVVGSGLGVRYPSANRRLWSEVAERGLLMSELPFDHGPTPSTFPARNRIIAQLAQVVVVVESAATGGSLITVDRALERGRPVLAVPGSPLSPVSAGTNELLRAGLLGPIALPCLGVADVLTLLDLEVVSNVDYIDNRPALSSSDEQLLHALGWDELSIGAVSARLAVVEQPRSLAEVSLGLARLEEMGWVTRIGGRWRRVGLMP